MTESHQFWLEMWKASAPFIAPALGVVLTSLIQWRTHRKVDTLEKKVDGKMDALIETTDKLARAEGNKEGRAELVQEIQVAEVERVANIPFWRKR